MENRAKAIKWWNNLSFEQKYFKVVEWLWKQGKDTTERLPDSLTGREIEEIYLNKHKK